MTYHEIFFLEYVSNISANLIATLIGAGVGFYFSLKVTNLQKEKNRITRKNKLVEDIKNELSDIKGHLTEPKKHYSNFKPLTYEDQMINGTQYSIDFIGYKQLMKSDTSDLFSYDTVQNIALVELHFQSYKRFEDIRLKFNVEYQHNMEARENLGKSIILMMERKKIQIIDSIDVAVKNLDSEEFKK